MPYASELQQAVDRLAEACQNTVSIFRGAACGQPPAICAKSQEATDCYASLVDGPQQFPGEYALSLELGDAIPPQAFPELCARFHALGCDARVEGESLAPMLHVRYCPAQDPHWTGGHRA